VADDNAQDDGAPVSKGPWSKSLRGWAGDLGPAVPIASAITYAYGIVLASLYFHELGISPAELGISTADIVVVAFIALAGVVAFAAVGALVGLAFAERPSRLVISVIVVFLLGGIVTVKDRFLGVLAFAPIAGMLVAYFLSGPLDRLVAHHPDERRVRTSMVWVTILGTVAFLMLYVGPDAIHDQADRLRSGESSSVPIPLLFAFRPSNVRISVSADDPDAAHLNGLCATRLGASGGVTVFLAPPSGDVLRVNTANITTRSGCTVLGK
jgi:hypothetical protein